MKINMKIALVHDFLTQLGGAERVLDELIEMYPQADVYTLVYDKEKTFGRYTKINLKTSFIQRLPCGVKHYKWYVALMPLSIQSFDLSKYDLIISDASAFAKGVRITNRKRVCKRDDISLDCQADGPTGLVFFANLGLQSGAKSGFICRELKRGARQD